MKQNLAILLFRIKRCHLCRMFLFYKLFLELLMGKIDSAVNKSCEVSICKFLSLVRDPKEHYIWGKKAYWDI